MIKKDFSAQIAMILGLTVVATFIGLGFFLIFSPTFNYIPKKSRTVFAVGMIVLGFFRLIILYQKFKKKEK